MLTLYGDQEASDWPAIRTAITETSLACQVLDRQAAPAALADQPDRTILVDDGDVFCGAGEILPHLEELIALRDQWHKYGSDACYCDDEGNIE